VLVDLTDRIEAEVAWRFRAIADVRLSAVWGSGGRPFLDRDLFRYSL
jgi:hypothetical protein